jgi:hypothetical protein
MGAVEFRNWLVYLDDSPQVMFRLAYAARDVDSGVAGAKARLGEAVHELRQFRPGATRR